MGRPLSTSWLQRPAMNWNPGEVWPGKSISDPDDEFHPGAFAGRAVHLAFSADALDSFAHVGQAVAGRDPKRILRAGGRADGGGIEAPAVILDGGGETRFRQSERNAHLGGRGVLDDIVQGFLEGQEKAVAHFGG